MWSGISSNKKIVSLISGDPNKDIFEQNPEIEYISYVKDFIKKSGGKKKASKLLWAVYLTEDPSSKLYKGMDIEERRSEVSNNYLNDSDFNWDALEDLISFYPKFALSKEEIFFDIWARKLDEVQVYFKHTNIAEFSDAEKLLKVMAQIPKLLEGYEEMKAKMIVSNKKTKTYGGKQESLSESGVI